MSTGRRTTGLEDLGDQAAEWKLKAIPPTTATPGREANPPPAPPGVCSYPVGCDQPPLEGRHYCHHHAAQLERRAGTPIPVHTQGVGEQVHR